MCVRSPSSIHAGCIGGPAWAAAAAAAPMLCCGRRLRRWRAAGGPQQQAFRRLASLLADALSSSAVLCPSFALWWWWWWWWWWWRREANTTHARTRTRTRTHCHVVRSPFPSRQHHHHHHETRWSVCLAHTIHTCCFACCATASALGFCGATTEAEAGTTNHTSNGICPQLRRRLLRSRASVSRATTGAAAAASRHDATSGAASQRLPFDPCREDRLRLLERGGATTAGSLPFTSSLGVFPSLPLPLPLPLCRKRKRERAGGRAGGRGRPHRRSVCWARRH